MAAVNIKRSFLCDVKKVWDAVTSLENYLWRSDLDRIEILGEGRFIEHTKGGYATVFTVTAREPLKRYEFDMENENMSGHWTGLFSCADGKTTVDFTECVAAKKFWMKPFVKGYLKKQQAAYMVDLESMLTR